MNKYVSAKEVQTLLGVQRSTLYRLEEAKKIDVLRTAGGKRLYNIKKYMRDNKIDNKSETRRKICYCRVSNSHQKEDLERQVKYMEDKYPDYEVIKEVGSGLNLTRKELKKIIKSAINGEIEEIVVAYKDRLCRFGYELINWIVEEYSDGKIRVENVKEETPQEEITKDIIQIMNVYSAKINGLRKYGKKIKEELTQKNVKNKSNKVKII